MPEITIDVNNFFYTPVEDKVLERLSGYDRYITKAVTRSGHEGVLIFIPTDIADDIIEETY